MEYTNTQYKDWLENQIELCLDNNCISQYEYHWIRTILVDENFDNESVRLINEIIAPDMNGNPIF